MLKNKRLAAFIRGLLVYAVFPNLAFAILSRFIFLTRPIVNLDYLAVGAVAVFFPRWVGGFLFALALSNDLLLNIGPIYHFRLLDFLRSTQDVVYLNFRYIAPILILLAASVAVLSWASAVLAARASAGKEKIRLSASLLSVAAFIALLEILNGTTVPFIHIAPANVAFSNVYLANSGLWRTYINLSDFQIHGDTIVKPIGTADSAMGVFLSSHGGRPAYPRVVLVVVESMGEFKDAAAESLMEGSLASPEILRRYRLTRGTVPFWGGTIYGEFRELCQVRLVNLGLTIPACLPKTLKRTEPGFESVGLHGFTNRFYRRYQWYPQLGFDRILMAEELYQAGATKQCGAEFQGICDTDVMKLIHQELLKGSRTKTKLVYWMTLNSHLPLDPAGGRESTLDCSQAPVTRTNPAICLHTRMISVVLEGMKAIAEDPAIPSTAFIIVGDHAPPYMTLKERSLYRDDRVPYMILTPKGSR